MRKSLKNELPILIRISIKNDIGKLQSVFNHKDVVGYLGGFTMEDSLKQKFQKNERTAISMWIAEVKDIPVGATMCGGRTQAHIMKYGEVGVLPEYRRRRIGSALYLAMTAQGILEGRRLYEDTIVGDNPTQFSVLPTLGLEIAGTLKNKTASGKDIVIFQFNLLKENALDNLLKRIPKNITIQIVESPYTKDLWEKNKLIYTKYLPDFIPKIEKMRDSIYASKNIHIITQEEKKKENKESNIAFFV